MLIFDQLKNCLVCGETLPLQKGSYCPNAKDDRSTGWHLYYSPPNYLQVYYGKVLFSIDCYIQTIRHYSPVGTYDYDAQDFTWDNLPLKLDTLINFS